MGTVILEGQYDVRGEMDSEGVDRGNKVRGNNPLTGGSCVRWGHKHRQRLCFGVRSVRGEERGVGLSSPTALEI